MNKKIIFVVCDGLGDRPVEELGGKTPLEAAKTPNLDRLAKQGVCGIMDTAGVGIRCGSDVAHLSLFGYDPKIYYPGRGVFEALGVGMDVKEGDVVLRVNFGSVDDSLNIVDRRAGRITDVSPFVKDINEITIKGIKFILKAGTGHRAALILRGKNICPDVSDSDPHITGVKVLKVKPLKKTKNAEFTAQILNQFLLKTHKILSKNFLNQEREKKGLLKANFLLTRGASKLPNLPSFEKKYSLKAACIAGAGLYKGIAKALGMEVIKVKGATGLPNTDLIAKFEAAVSLLQEKDFIFVHIKSTDIFGEDGNYEGKKMFIEKIDKAIKIILDQQDVFVVLTADHSTPCQLSAHSGDPVPLIIAGPGVRRDDVFKIGERDCAKGGLHRIKALDLMPEIINLLGLAKLYGE